MPKGKMLLSTTNFVIHRPVNRAEMRAVQKSFGLFSDPPSTSGFDPATDVTRDVIPQEKDYVYVPFRMISASILGAYTWKATDFSDEKILKRSVKLLANKPVYVNHDMSNVMSNVGVIVNPRWTESFKLADGTVIPAGIDGVFKIDAKVHPKVARDLLSNPPSIQSDSVTILYEYEQSHEFTNREGEENPWEFEYKIGTMVDGRMVRRIVTGINDYIECSLVSLGADPFGKILVNPETNLIDVDGVPLNVDRTAIAPASAYSTAKFEKDVLRPVYEQKQEYFLQHCYSEKNNIDLKKRLISNGQTHKKSTIMDEILEFLAAETGLAENDLTVDAFKKAFKVVKLEDFSKYKGQASKVTQLEKQVEALTEDKSELTTKVTDFEGKVTELEKEKTALTVPANFGKQVLSAKREEAKKMYRLHSGTKVDEAYYSVIDKADEKELDAILKQHGGRVLETYGGVCKKCQSTEIEYRSSMTEPDPNKPNKPVEERRHLAYGFS